MEGKRVWLFATYLILISMVTAVIDNLVFSELKHWNTGPLTVMVYLFTSLLIAMVSIVKPDLKTMIKVFLPSVLTMIAVVSIVRYTDHGTLIGVLGLTLVLIATAVIYKFRPSLWQRIHA